MVYLAKCKRAVCPLKSISKEERISFDYLEKILSKLEKAVLVEGEKRRSGRIFFSQKTFKDKNQRNNLRFRRKQRFGQMHGKRQALPHGEKVPGQELLAENPKNLGFCSKFNNFG